jgi:hypothetical protein
VTYGALSGRIGRPEARPAKALDTIWNLDAVDTKVEDYQGAAAKIRDIYALAFPEAASRLPSSDDLSQFVAELFRRHPSMAAVRFWRLLVSGAIAHFDNLFEGEERTTEQVYDDVMNRLREE